VRWLAAAAAAALVVAASVLVALAAGRIGDHRAAPQQGIDHAVGFGGVQLLHDGCEPLLIGWHLSWGQPIRYGRCGFRG